jgi:hypothetical protein
MTLPEASQIVGRRPFVTALRKESEGLQSPLPVTVVSSSFE